MKTSPVKSERPAVLIVGDDAIVVEYASLVTAAGHRVFYSEKIKTLKSVSQEISIALELTNLDPALKKSNLVAMDKTLSATTAILSSSITVSTLEQAGWIWMKHRLIGIAALPSLSGHRTIEVAPCAHTLDATIDVTRRFFASIKKETAVVQDRVGMVLPRILCQVINEALFAVQQGVAEPKDIDIAMKLGTNYPMGPIEWGEKIGFNQVNAVIAALFADLGEERYRVCPLLKELATTGKFWG